VRDKENFPSDDYLLWGRKIRGGKIRNGKIKRLAKLIEQL
jgi:hypothetical protein